MKHLIIFIFILVFILFGHELGYDDILPVWKHVTYNFQHADFWHLTLNSISFFYMFRVLERHIRPVNVFLISLIIAFFMSFFCIYDQVVVGASGMIYAQIGMYFALVARRKIRYKDKTPLYIFLGSVAVFLALSFIKGNSAGLLHLLCLISGFVSQYLLSLKLLQKQQHSINH